MAKKTRWYHKCFAQKGDAGSIDLVFLILVFCLLTFGLIMVASASYVSALHNEGDSFYYIKRQVFFAALGVAGMFFVTRFNYNWFRRWIPWLLVLTVILLVLVLIPGIGVKAGGARRWLNFGIQFQPSEIAKLALIMTLASYMAANYEDMKKLKVGILPTAGLLLVICGLVAVETHISCAILLFGIGIVMMFVGGVDLRWYLGIGGTGVAAMAGFIAFTPYARTRIYTWLHPFEDVTGDSFQTVQSLYAIGSGGLLGRGLGNSYQKHLYIPEPQNDYIFSIVCEELGFIGAMMVIILFVLLIWRGFVIAYHARDKFGSFLVIGIMSQVAIQVILNIGVVTNAVPPTGIALPFFSYGGTALLLLLAEMGLVLGVSRYSRLDTKE